jgi:hypothetical protein
MTLRIEHLERINNRDSAKYVSYKQEFQGSNMYAIHLEGKNKHTYVVYSYGPHWPMWVYDYGTREWYGMLDKFSRTTSKQQGQSHPDVPNDSIHWYGEDMMIKIAVHGFNGAFADRLGVTA